MAQARLRLRWRALAGTHAVADAAFDDVARRYSEARRHHHTLEHVEEVLDVVDSLAGSEPVQYAAWLHDVVYDPRQGGNEAASAAYAAGLLPRLGVDAAAVEEVVRLIELTAGHVVAPGDVNGAVLADADLAILGAPPSRYERYAAAVREEYAWVPDDAWRTARARVLGGFLARERLFHDEGLRASLDPQARENLTSELATLA